jgi:hypothetical protein
MAWSNTKPFHCNDIQARLNRFSEWIMEPGMCSFGLGIRNVVHIFGDQSESIEWACSLCQDPQPEYSLPLNSNCRDRLCYRYLRSR